MANAPIITREDVAEAVQEIVEVYLPNRADQVLCAQETWDNRADGGFPNAFSEALGKLGLDAELVKKLVKQFDPTLRETSKARKQREDAATRAAEKAAEEAVKAAEKAAEEARKAAEKAAEVAAKAAEKAAEEAAKEAERLRVENLKNEISANIANLAALQRNGKELQGQIGTIARSARDLARKNVDPAVATALETVAEVVEEMNQLVDKMSSTVREARDDARKDDLAAVKAAVTEVEGIYDRLEVLRTPEIDNAHDAVQTAVDESNDRKTAEETSAAVQRLVDKAQANLDAIDGDEGIASKVRAAVRNYRVAFVAHTGTPLPTDPADAANPDRLTTNANNALRDARTANSDVVTHAGIATPVQADVESAAGRVATARTNAQAALDDITQRSNALQDEKALEEAQGGHTATQQKKKEEEKAKKDGQFDRLLASWKGQLTLFGLFVLGIILGLLFFPVVAQIALLFTALAALGVYGLALLKGKPKSGAVVLGGHFIVVVIFLLLLALTPLIGKGPGSDRNIIPVASTSTPTPEPTAQMEAVATIPPDKTPTPSN